MSPTVFREKGYRFFFLSNEEPRMHVHATCEKGEAKVWLEPVIALADYYGLRERELNQVIEMVTEHRDEIIEAWKQHFSQR